MERIHRNSSFESLDNLQTNLRRRGIEKQVKNTARGFRRKYSRFRKGTIDDTTLFKGDFVLENISQEEGGTLKIIDDISGDAVTPVRYFDVFRKFREIIDSSLYTDEFDTGTTRNIKPDMVTSGLKTFIEENPDSRVKIRYLLIHLLSFADETEQIMVSRYINPETNLPIAEVWAAHRTRNVQNGGL